MKTINKRGFTIIELAVSAIAILLLLGVVFKLIQRNLYPGFVTDSKIDTQQDARMAIAFLTNDIRRSHQLKIESGKMTLKCFTGKPRIGYPNAGLEAAQVEIIEYYRAGKELYRDNKTTNVKKLVGKNVTDFRPTKSKDGSVVGLIIEAELEVLIERQVFDKVKTVIYTKVYPRHLAEKNLYKGYFCSVDEDGTY